jgi:hypothetical protein
MTHIEKLEQVLEVLDSGRPGQARLLLETTITEERGIVKASSPDAVLAWLARQPGACDLPPAHKMHLATSIHQRWVAS